MGEARDDQDGADPADTRALVAGWQVGRLSARPSSPTGDRPPAGVHRLGDDPAAELFVPASLPDGPVPLVVLLHGATSNPGQAIPLLQREAEQRGFLILAPTSRGTTWDLIERGSFGPDVAGIDLTLALLFERVDVDPARLAMAGFSDGASYALSVGATNGDLFTHLLAFSPGFAMPGRPVGRPPTFISHGVDDPILPIDHCSRRLVPVMRANGYDVTYEEFDGGHEVRRAQRAAALDLLLGPP